MRRTRGSGPARNSSSIEFWTGPSRCAADPCVCANASSRAGRWDDRRCRRKGFRAAQGGFCLPPADKQEETIMAYLNFSELQGSPVAMPADVMPVTGFSALEWQVVAIAQHAGLSSLEKPSRLSVALGMVFGGEAPNPKL